MLVSIVTPSYNQGHFIEETIQSVLSQDYPEIEYLILDGGSKDNSVAVIRQYQQRLAYWTSQKDAGQSDAINQGFARARGEILAWINSDDTYQPGAVREAVEYLRTHPEVGMVYGDANLTDASGQVVGQFAARQTGYRSLLRGSVHIPQATTFFRAELFRQVGPLSTSLFIFDYDLWVKLARISELRYVPRLWANFRLHESGKSVANDDLFYPEMLKVYEREVGGWFSQMRLRWYARRLLYAWLPWRLRLRLRKALTR